MNKFATHLNSKHEDVHNSNAAVIMDGVNFNNTSDQAKSLIKRGIWIYFLLLIFEGGLRKWFLPGLATPLLVVRDPVALWIMYMAWKQGLFPKSLYITGMAIAGMVSLCTTLLFGHGNLFVAIYGARILLIHFPLMFTIARVMNHGDIIKLGRVLLWISIPMIVLTALQFYSPQTAWVNRGVGGDEAGSGFSGSLGYMRPSSSFSFTNGTTLFFSLVAAFVIYFWLNPKYVNRVILLSSSVAVIAAIPLSISRSLLFTILLSLMFAIIASMRSPKYIGKIIATSIVLILGVLLLSQLSFFQTATEAFTSRFEKANEVEGGVESVLTDRYLGGLVNALSLSKAQNFFGYGIGMGTNVGGRLMTGGQAFLISEGEWGRLIGEMGALLGIFVIFLRLSFSLKISIFSYKKLAKGDLLPWMLLSYALLIIPQGQWGQPTSLGFSTLVGGMLLSALKGEPRTLIHGKI